jgi:multidrug efflux pump subunit AcrB
MNEMNGSGRIGSGAIEWMIRNPIAANLVMIILLGGGIWTASQIQKEVFPQYALDVVEVSVGYPGAAPSEVEQGILQPVEEAIRSVRGIKSITSQAREGRASIEIELVSGTDRMKAFQDIDQAVNRIRTFPDDIEQPEVRLGDNQQDVMNIGLYGDVDIWTLRTLAEQLRDILLSDPAITQVSLGRAPEYMTHVEVSQDRLREYGLTLGEISRTIASSSGDVAAGAVETGTGEILLRLKERKQWADEFSKIVVIPSFGGAAVTLGDIADITDGFDEGGFHERFNGGLTVGLNVFRIGSQSPLDIAEAVERIMPDFETTLPPGVTYRISQNAAEDYNDRLSLLVENGFLGIVIVFVILALFLEYRLAFWVMMGMTTAFIGGLVFLPVIGVSINMISMFAFLVVLGIVVDDAIVVGENVHEYREQGLDYITASIRGARDIAGPVTFSILTNIVAFVPLLFMPGETGKFWWPLPAVVIVVLTVSLLEALYILPAHLSHKPKKTEPTFARTAHRWQQSFAHTFNQFVDQRYRAFLDLCIRNRYVTVTSAVTILLVVGGYGYSDHMGMVMMPELSADEIEAGIRMPQGTTILQSGRIANEVTDATMRMIEEHDLHHVAEGVKTNVRGSSFIDVEIAMRPPDEHDMTAADVISIWRENIGDIDGVDQITFEAERGPGGHRRDISIGLSHSDISVLEKASLAFKERVSTYEETREVNTDYRRGKAQFDFVLRPEGRHLGLTPSAVGRQVRDAFYGSLAMRQLRGTNETEIRVKLPIGERRDLRHLESFTIRTPDGTVVPLMDVVEIKRGEAFSRINRRDGRRMVTASMDVEPKRAMSRVLESIKREELPQLRADYPGLTWTFRGTQAEMRESTQALWGGFTLAMAVIYALLAIAFGSYVQPLIVMTAIPFGIVGAVLGHIVLGYDLSLISLMGVIALSGVVVNDSLIMIDYANKKRRDTTPFEAIHQAGLRRFRPIILTTLTTFGGLSPIIMETSRQAYYLVPMAISLGFGIIFATSIILLLVPCLYMILEDVMALLSPASADADAITVGD